jgi:hypothetical protein
MMQAEDRALAVTCAARLHGQLQLAWWALAVTLLAGAALLLGHAGRVWWCAAVVAGLAERYIALRLRLDAELFLWLARPDTGLAQLDAALAAQGMGRKAGRSLAERVRGTQVWVRRHVVICIAQLALAACAFSATGG